MPLRISLAQCPVWSCHAAPLGLASVQAWLRRSGYDTRAYDLNLALYRNFPSLHGVAEQVMSSATRRAQLALCLARGGSLAEAAEELRSVPKADLLLAECQRMASCLLAHDPHIVGFSTQHGSLPLALLCARAITEAAQPRPVLLLGGPGCSEAFTLRHSLQAGVIDWAVLGEGEQPLAALLADSHRIGHSLEPQLLTCHAFPAPVMDELPTPDFAGLPLASYTEGYLPLLSSRGCVGRCSFCQERDLWCGFRQRSPARVVQDMRRLSAETGFSQFRLNDSLVNGDLRWLRAFCEELERTALGFRWFANARVHPGMTADLLRRLGEAGCAGLMFGVESASQPVLERLRKGISVGVARTVLRNCSQAGIMTHTYWMFGCPGERAEDVSTSLRFIAEHVRVMDSIYLHRYGPSTAEVAASGRWATSRLHMNLPLFRALFRCVQHRMGSRYDALGMGTGRQSQDIVHRYRTVRLMHPARQHAILLLAVLDQAIRALDESGWVIVRPDPSYLEHGDLEGAKVLLLLSTAEGVTEFLRGLCESQVAQIKLCWVESWSPEMEAQIDEWHNACRAAGVACESEPACPMDEKAGQTPRCEVCVATMDAAPQEIAECARHVETALGLGRLTPSDVWMRRDTIHREFMSRLCALRRDRSCRSCRERQPRPRFCSHACCQQDRNPGEGKTIFDGWY